MQIQRTVSCTLSLSSKCLTEIRVRITRLAHPPWFRHFAKRFAKREGNRRRRREIRDRYPLTSQILRCTRNYRAACNRTMLRAPILSEYNRSPPWRALYYRHNIIAVTRSWRPLRSGRIAGVASGSACGSRASEQGACEGLNNGLVINEVPKFSRLRSCASSRRALAR